MKLNNSNFIVVAANVSPASNGGRGLKHPSDDAGVRVRRSRPPVMAGVD